MLLEEVISIVGGLVLMAVGYFFYQPYFWFFAVGTLIIWSIHAWLLAKSPNGVTAE